jgi:hypothetical protein
MPTDNSAGTFWDQSGSQQTDDSAGTFWDTSSKPTVIPGKGAVGHDPRALRAILAASEWASQSPVARGLDALMNMSNRTVLGTMAGKNPLYAATHPAMATEFTHGAERSLGLPVYAPEGKDASGKIAGYNPWLGAAQSAEDFALESATSFGVGPLEKLAFRGLGALGRASRASRAVEALGKTAAGKKVAGAVDSVLRATVEGHDLRKSVTRSGEDVVKTHEGRWNNRTRHAEQDYGALIEKHRPELDALDQQKAVLSQRIRDLYADKELLRLERQRAKFSGLPEPTQALRDEIRALHPPEEIRQALLRRAYLEGTPQVRRQVIARGYRPTAEEQAAEPLNILHRFRDEYEPTQTVFKESDLKQTAGSFRYVHQGNRRAKFDLPKEGSTATDPLADRLLDRLVRGARLEAYHRSRRDILKDLGLTPQPPLQPVLDALEAAGKIGDPAQAARKTGLLSRVLIARNEAAKAAEAKRALHLKPDAPVEARTLEFLDPKTAQQRALRQVKRAGHPGILPPGVSPTTGQDLGFLRQLERGPQDVREMRGKVAARAGTLPDFKRLAGRAQETAAKVEARAAQTAAKLGTPRSLRSIVTPAKQNASLAEAIALKQGRVAQRTGESLKTAMQRNDAISKAKRAAEEAIASGNTAKIPATLDERLFGDRKVYEGDILQAFSDLQRDALFVIPFAHMKNIAVLAALGPGGLRTVQRGIRYAHELRTNPTGLAARVKGLEELGATTHYIREDPSRLASLPKVGGAVDAVTHRSNEALERYDLGMRLALEDALRRRGTSGFAIGGQVRDVLGDYQNQAPAIQKLRAHWGANFPGWRLGVVPRALTKAVRENRGAVRSYARSQRLISDDVTQPLWGADFDLAGPAEDYSKFLEPPVGTVRYLTSQSTIGPAGLIPQGLNALLGGRLSTFVGQQAERLLPQPIGTIAGAAMNWPFPTTAPPAARLGAGIFGSYFPKSVTQKKRRAQLSALGMKGAELDDQLRREGLRPERPATQPIQTFWGP